MTQAERRALKQELRLLDAAIEAATDDYQIKQAERDHWYHGRRNGIMHPRNSGPRHRDAFASRCRLQAIQNRMREIREQLYLDLSPKK